MAPPRQREEACCCVNCVHAGYVCTLWQLRPQQCRRLPMCGGSSGSGDSFHAGCCSCPEPSPHLQAAQAGGPQRLCHHVKREHVAVDGGDCEAGAIDGDARANLRARSLAFRQSYPEGPEVLLGVHLCHRGHALHDAGEHCCYPQSSPPPWRACCPDNRSATQRAPRPPLQRAGTVHWLGRPLAWGRPRVLLLLKCGAAAAGGVMGVVDCSWWWPGRQLLCMEPVASGVVRQARGRPAVSLSAESSQHASAASRLHFSVIPGATVSSACISAAFGL